MAWSANFSSEPVMLKKLLNGVDIFIKVVANAAELCASGCFREVWNF
jgi:hypothetical protein